MDMRVLTGFETGSCTKKEIEKEYGFEFETSFGFPEISFRIMEVLFEPAERVIIETELNVKPSLVDIVYDREFGRGYDSVGRLRDLVIITKDG